MNKPIFVTSMFSALLIAGALYMSQPEVVQAEDYYDDSYAMSCVDYARKCRDAGGRHNSPVGERSSTGEGYMTCDGISSGASTSEFQKAVDGSVCSPENKRGDLAGCERDGRTCYCVVAKCQYPKGEEDYPMYE